MKYSFFVGWDRREHRAWNVCVRSLLAHMETPWPIAPISMEHLAEEYTRPTERRNGRLWDVISGAYCSTMFSIARFWTPLVARSNWAIYMDGDFLIRADIQGLLDLLDDRYAVMVVKHAYESGKKDKMDGQIQYEYPRKNWSSLMCFNMIHAANNGALAQARHTETGLQLHRLEQYADAAIGELPRAWNHLVGIYPYDGTAKAVHFTQGDPSMSGWENQDYAKEWWAYT